jgi:hypothetical protein
VEWFFIEALVALAVGIAIVWWTIAPQRKLPRDRSANADAASSASKQTGAAKSAPAAKVD